MQPIESENTFQTLVVLVKECPVLNKAVLEQQLVTFPQK
jgi:hypothetical protein